VRSGKEDWVPGNSGLNRSSAICLGDKSRADCASGKFVDLTNNPVLLKSQLDICRKMIMIRKTVIQKFNHP
jgi:hypothetical protein